MLKLSQSNTELDVCKLKLKWWADLLCNKCTKVQVQYSLVFLFLQLLDLKKHQRPSADPEWPSDSSERFKPESDEQEVDTAGGNDRINSSCPSEACVSAESSSWSPDDTFSSDSGCPTSAEVTLSAAFKSVSFCFLAGSVSKRVVVSWVVACCWRCLRKKKNRAFQII